jgi:hypothetical protein
VSPPGLVEQHALDVLTDQLLSICQVDGRSDTGDRR